MDVMNPGQALSRDIAKGKYVDAEIDAFISRRHDQRVKTEGERALEDLWREAERKEARARRERNRGGWLAHYRHLERVHLERAAACGARADELEGTA